MKNKPLTLRVKESEDKLIKVIEESGLPIFCLKKILQDLYVQLENADNLEIQKYNEELKNSANKKESDK